MNQFTMDNRIIISIYWSLFIGLRAFYKHWLYQQRRSFNKKTTIKKLINKRKTATSLHNIFKVLFHCHWPQPLFVESIIFLDHFHVKWLLFILKSIQANINEMINDNRNFTIIEKKHFILLYAKTTTTINNPNTRCFQVRKVNNQFYDALTMLLKHFWNFIHSKHTHTHKHTSVENVRLSISNRRARTFFWTYTRTRSHVFCNCLLCAPTKVWWHRSVAVQPAVQFHGAMLAIARTRCSHAHWFFYLIRLQKECIRNTIRIILHIATEAKRKKKLRKMQFSVFSPFHRVNCRFFANQEKKNLFSNGIKYNFFFISAHSSAKAKVWKEKTVYEIALNARFLNWITVESTIPIN